MAVLAMIVGACTGPARASASPTTAPSEATAAVVAGSSPACAWSDIYDRCLPPVDPAIKPISLSHPGADAAAVLAFCFASGTDMEVVAGGRIPRGRDAWEYVPVPRYQIEIQSDQPVWLLQLRGQFIHSTPSGAPAGAGIEQDPLCIVGPRFPGFIDVRGAGSSAITRSLPSPAP